MPLFSWASRPIERRTFLRVAGGTAAAAGLTLAGCQDNSASPTTTTTTYVLTNNDTGQLNYLYTQKQLQVAFYQLVITTPPADLQAGELAILTDLRDHAIVHARSLGYAIGATAVLPQLVFDFSTLPLTTRTAVLTAALTFADQCAAALNFTIPFVATPETLLFLTRIASVEARQAATLRDLLAPATLAAPDDVLTAGGPLANTVLPATVIAAIAPYFPTAVIDVSLLPVV